MSVSESQALDELRKALQLDQVTDDPDAYTVAEMAEAWDMSSTAVRRLIDKQDGLLERVTVWRFDSIGRRYKATAYKVKGEQDG